MFTWEEAGLLRSMLQVTVWGVLALALIVAAVVERKPLVAGARCALHRIEIALHPSTHGTPPAHQPRR